MADPDLTLTYDRDPCESYLSSRIAASIFGEDSYPDFSIAYEPTTAEDLAAIRGLVDGQPARDVEPRYEDDLF